jgi:hypothetical protein
MVEVEEAGKPSDVTGYRYLRFAFESRCRVRHGRTGR